MECSAKYWKPRLESVAPSTSSCGHSSQQQGVTEPIRPEGSYSLCGQRSAQVQQSSPAVSKHMCAPRQSRKRILYEEQSQPCFQAPWSVALEFGARSTFSPLTDRLSHTDGPSAQHEIHRNKPRCQQPAYKDDIDNQYSEATLAAAAVAPVGFQEARPAWRVHIPPAAPSAIPKPTPAFQALHAHVKSSNRHVTSTPGTDGTFRGQSNTLGCKRPRQQAVTVDVDDRNVTTVWHYGASNSRQRNLDGLKQPQRRVGGRERDGAILPDLRLTEVAAEGEIHSVRLPNVRNEPNHTFPQVGFPQAVPPATCPMGPSWLHADRDRAEPGGGLIAALSSSFVNSSNAHRERVMYLEIPALERQRLPTPSRLQGEVRLVRQVEEVRHRTPPEAGYERVHETWQEEQQEKQEQWQGWAECWPAPRGQTCERQSTSVAGPSIQRNNKSASDNHSVTRVAWSDCGVGCSGGTMQRASSPLPPPGSSPDTSHQPSESPEDLGSVAAGIDVSCPMDALAVILGVQPSNESHRAAGREALHEALILLTTRYYAEKGLTIQ